MSSSGLIYAFIVGAWAVYLVPMWLRREDELNAARQTQRYTTAIKVLSHKDSFERKHGAATEREEAQELPAAVGAGAAGPAAGSRTLEKVRDKDRERQRREGEPRQAREAVASRPRGAREPGVTARLPRESASAAAGRAASAATPTPAAAEPRTAPGQRPAASSPVTSAASGRAPGAGSAAASTAATSSSHALLRVRRRRVVGVLFAITSLGAIISADLGLSYVWVMLIPAAVLSGYIVWVRKDEQSRAAERARRRTAAIRAARETERRRQEEREHAEREAEFAEQAEQAEREELARRSAVARRRVAAARSRADRHTSPDQGDLPRAANG